MAEVNLPSRHVLIDVVRAFGLGNPQLAEPLIKRKVGETVAKNDLLAETGGIFSRMIRCQVEGKIVSIDNGQILIESQNQTLSLKANYSGTVQKIIPNRGVEIEMNCALVQGAWGNNRLTSGNIVCKSQTASSEIEVNSLDLTARDMILVGGTILNAKLFELAAALPVAGMILGSMPASLRETALKQPYPILLVDGFGKTGMNQPAWKLLTAKNSSEITLNAEFSDNTGETRPEIVIALQEEIEENGNSARLSSGQTVRIHTAPFMGKVGVIDKILPVLTTLSNGLRVCAASVIVDKKKKYNSNCQS
jgi:hypothetical protein